MPASRSWQLPESPLTVVGSVVAPTFPTFKQLVLHSPALSRCSCSLLRTRSNSRVFSLVIGINQYKYPVEILRTLTGCVADANAFSEFLNQSLLVPQDRIVNLRNATATRDAILRNIRSMSFDDRIERGDPIVIYFAGYGSKANAPKSWEARGAIGRVPMLLPHDFAPWTNDDGTAQGITMLTLATLLRQLSQVKGDNIVSDLHYYPLPSSSIPLDCHSRYIVFRIQDGYG